MDYTTPPLFPFQSFGSTNLEDTNLDVHEHSLCGKDHSLSYVGLTWHCNDGREVMQRPEVPLVAIRQKTGPPLNKSSEVDVDYDDYDSDDHNSEMVTRNIFTWLRGQDGFPVAEREIRKHEWIDNLDSDDDEPIEGETPVYVSHNLIS
ncbi:immunoglobulin variable region used by the itc63b heavy chain [Fusarium flagelliforme]|uniref:Immunoglobulin variable region used by the itc63b heavy chain n=1 Tax=Fusarium flagelliforme TaxID=2675880 RepID=A0A395MLY0_9HYPO|nr:immunoglobulin variable region used by the itc63b heavy chain [Fusarium flagelliforme]